MTYDWLPGDKAILHRDHMGVATDIEVRVMAVAEGYAMVRRPYCVPTVKPIGELHKPERPGRSTDTSSPESGSEIQP